ncbi:hypothetical protein Peur_006745 [Populus x canadensis]
MEEGHHDLSKVTVAGDPHYSKTKLMQYVWLLLLNFRMMHPCGGSQACFPDVLNSQLKGLAFYINKFFSSSLALTKWRSELDLTLTHDILSSQCAIQSKSWIIISQSKDAGKRCSLFC